MTDPPFEPQAAPTASDLLLVALAAALLFLIGTGHRDLWNPNEPIYGRAVVEMAERGDWLVPTVNGRVFAEKPALYYQGALVAAELTGEVDELSLRLPAVLAGVVSAVLVHLLVLPYAGRRRALLATAIFATQYQVFWVARSVQMDVLVLLGTLGALVPLSRMLDFGASPTRSWCLAGAAVGFGFAGKGPVAIVLPAVVIAAYAASTGRFRRLLGRPLACGVGVGIAVASPWYLGLLLEGRLDVLHEVLVRQNFARFTDAWDHRQPWWYFLKYLWIDYAPWSVLLPAAALQRRGDRDAGERSLDRLAWIWIVGIVFFFSLSESKRAPYIVPVAPAIAALVAGVVDRWAAGGALARRALIAARGAVVVLAAGFLVGGAAPFVAPEVVPEVLLGAGRVAAGLLLLGGSLLAASFLARRSRLAPAILMASWVSLLVFAAGWLLPRLDAVKSARPFAERMVAMVEATDGELASAGLWQWRSGYQYYGDLVIPQLDDAAAGRDFWRSHASPLVLVERRGRERARPAWLPADARVVLEGTIGGRVATVYGRAEVLTALSGEGDHGPAHPLPEALTR